MTTEIICSLRGGSPGNLGRSAVLTSNLSGFGYCSERVIPARVLLFNLFPFMIAYSKKEGECTAPTASIIPYEHQLNSSPKTRGEVSQRDHCAKCQRGHHPLHKRRLRTNLGGSSRPMGCHLS